MRSVCRPGEGQRQLYNRHKRVHGIKFQLIVCPDGMIANLYGPNEGRHHDSFMLARSRILDQLQWNLSKADTYGTKVFVRFREVSSLERFELKSSQI